jgi:hypothetical protein
MRTLEEIKSQVIELVKKCPGITEDEIGKQLKLSYRFGRKLFDDMVARGELCPMS